MQGMQLPTPDAIREAQEKSKQRMQAAMAQARQQDGPDEPDEDDEADDEGDEADDETSGTELEPEIEQAIATIAQHPTAIMRLKHMLGIREDLFQVTYCKCPECVYEGEPGTRFYRSTRQCHWFCYVCGGGPYVWQLTQPPFIKPISRHGVLGEAHYCCGSACQSRYESRYGLHRQQDYYPEGSHINPTTNVVAR